MARKKTETAQALDDAVNDALGALEQATDLTAEQALENLVQASKAYFAAQDAKKTVSDEQKQLIARAWEALKTNIEESTSVGTKDELMGKLRRIEMSYQEYVDAEAFAVEAKKAAKEEIAATKEQLQRAITDGHQLTLNFA